MDTPPEAVLKKTYHGEDFLRIFQEFEAYLQEKQAMEEKLVFPDDEYRKWWYESFTRDVQVKKSFIFT